MTMKDRIKTQLLANGMRAMSGTRAGYVIGAWRGEGLNVDVTYDSPSSHMPEVVLHERIRQISRALEPLTCLPGVTVKLDRLIVRVQAPAHYL